MMDTNSAGTVWTVRAAVPEMLRTTGGGDIVIAASVAGLSEEGTQAITRCHADGVAGTHHSRAARAGRGGPSMSELLTGGDPRTLYNVDVVVEAVLDHPEDVDGLIRCILESDDEVVRMRAGDALEKVCRRRPALLQPHVSRVLGDLAQVDQPSVQWHVAQMLGELELTNHDEKRAVSLLCANLDESGDWIVLNCSLDTLAILARRDPELVEALCGYLDRFRGSRYKSLANRSGKLRAEFCGAGPASP